MVELTNPVRRIETAALMFQRRPDVFRPRDDQGSKGIVGAGLIAMQSTLLGQIASKSAKPDSGLVVTETRSGDHADIYIGQARCVAVAVLQAERDHAANH